MSKDADGSVVLEGVFTQIGVKNKNNRIYEEAEVLPHINELKEKVKTNKLLGELDHPKDFDISLSNVSHVIEDLEYDKDKKQVLGRIRLLNTSKGKEAQALIEDGIPLHISSRAAGTVDEAGKVKIKKFFTYDLVADPGFENAELARVNESYGFEDTEGLYIYEMDNPEDEINKTNKTDLTMENNSGNFVTVEDFNKYTEYVKNTLDGVKESANSNNDELLQKLVAYTEHVAEKVNQVTDYTEYLSENLDKSISHSDYLAENVDKIKNYSSYLGEELDRSIQYSEHVAEQADKGIAYSNYLGESLEKGIEYSEYVAEKVDQNIAYSEYLGEGLSKSIKYTEYIAENVNAVEGTVINENTEPTIEESINESIKTKENSKSYKDAISEKLDNLISKAETKNVSEMHFMNFLSESKKNEFDSLADNKKVLIVESMNSNSIMSTVQAENVWDSCFITERKAISFIDDMPEKFHTKWEALPANRQEQIIAESKFHSLNTPYAINNFWQTRDMRSTQMSLESINENKTAAEAAHVKSEPLVNEDFQADLIKQMKFRLGR
jgi:hypothetical protein|tara:strand:- start:1613 stop:3271 length:1659 start_codon:yes stop_codon:yes gene_type:complete